MKQMFSDQLVDLMSEFIYNNLNKKTVTRTNLKKSIRAFENMWVSSVREIKKNDKRKVLVARILQLLKT